MSDTTQRIFHWRGDKLEISEPAPPLPPPPPEPVEPRHGNSADESPAFDRGKLIRSSDLFAHRLGTAILNGQERCRSVVSVAVESERPALFIVSDPPSDLPSKPQRATNIAEKLRRQEFADTLRARAQETEGPTPKRGRYTVLQLSSTTCRYPTTDDSPFFFCGAPVSSGSYCVRHARVCFR